MSKYRKKGPGRSKQEPMRLNRYLAHCGIASRRKADELIQNGDVKVNGKVVKEMGITVKPGDKVMYKGKIVTPGKMVYILLNKPKGVITTTDDERDRQTVIDLIESMTTEKVYPVGRLDRNTTGLLLLTNDGDLKQKLTHPKHGVKKYYQVKLDAALSQEDEEKLRNGLELEDGAVEIDGMSMVQDSNRFKWVIELHIGRNRIVRRIFEHLGYEVVALDRIGFGGLTKERLPRGRARHLRDKEVIFLKHFK